jgi:hypothetical protein
LYYTSTNYYCYYYYYLLLLVLLVLLLLQAIIACSADENESNEKRVLEVGFGLGISADYLDQQEGVTFHHIIEANEDVAARAVEFAEHARCHTKISIGFWQAHTHTHTQLTHTDTHPHTDTYTDTRTRKHTHFTQDVVATLPDASFDGILFDCFPLTAGELVDGESSSFFAHAARLLRAGGVFTFYFDVARSWYHCKQVFETDTTKQLLSAGFDFVGSEEIEITPDQDCAYIWGGILHKHALPRTHAHTLTHTRTHTHTQTHAHIHAHTHTPTQIGFSPLLRLEAELHQAPMS